MYIEISIATQTLQLFDEGGVDRCYSVSTAKNGPGERMGSECTPRGEHVVSEKIGAGCAVNTVFVGRVPTGEIYIPAWRTLHTERDWILTRILHLSGSEAGKNKGGNVDSYDRHIYIHGSPDDSPMGKPGSRGCIRMRNVDIIELFDAVETGVRVVIHADQASPVICSDNH